MKKKFILLAMSAVLVFSVCALPAGTTLTLGTAEAATVLPTDTTTASEGNALVGVSGSFVAPTKKVLNKINEIRKEACTKGIKDPRDTSRKLTSSDYVPIKWSSDLEYIARIRAAEGSISLSHTRPNGSSCFSVTSPNGVGSYGEVLAWNYSEDFLMGIQQWYSEKSAWVKGTSGAVTGHYTSMINPNNTYVGLATFLNYNATYPTTTSGEFSSLSGLNEKMGSAAKNCVQTVEVQSSTLKKAYLSGASSAVAGKKAKVSMRATYDNDGMKIGVSILGGTTWTSSNGNVASVSSNGYVTGISYGTTTITAVNGSLKASTKFSIVSVKVADKDALSKISKTFNRKIKAKKGSSIKLPSVKSASGSKVVYKLSKSSKYFKVSKDGFVKVKKALKRGKKYTIKVKATCGKQSKKIKVKLKAK